MAELSGPMKCLKCSVFILNVICLLCAIVLIAAGAYVEVQFVQYGGELHQVWQAAPIAVIVVGSIIFLVSFLGCCGAIKGNVCMLYMYAVLLVLLLIAELAAAIVAVVYKDKIRDEVDTALTDAVKSFSADNPQEIKKFIDAIQTTFQCCVKGASEHKELAETCVDTNVDCVIAFSDYLKRNLVILACVAFGVCFFQLLSIIIACCLGQRIREYENV